MNYTKLYGEKNNKSSTVIQWSIRNSIRSINKNISEEKLYNIFHLPNCDRSIAPKYFFITTVDYLRNK